MITSDLHIVCRTCGADGMRVTSEKDYRPEGPVKVFSASCSNCDCAGSAQGIGRIRLTVKR